MTIKERILHSVLFELIALVIAVPISSLITGHGATTMTGIMVGIAMIAMVWNYLFNLGFDRIFGQDRINRGWSLRVAHGLSFEIGLLAATIPFLMWQLNMDFWSVLILDLGFVVFFLGYAIIFNWSYDHVRGSLLNRMKAST